jgi:hypothetical protein
MVYLFAARGRVGSCVIEGLAGCDTRSAPAEQPVLR